MFEVFNSPINVHQCFAIVKNGTEVLLYGDYRKKLVGTFLSTEQSFILDSCMHVK